MRPEDLEQAAYDVERAVGEAERAASTAARLEDLVLENENGLVRAIVDARGRVREVQLNPRAMRMDRDTLAREITTTVRRAQDKQADRALTVLGVLPSAEEARTQLERIVSELANDQAG
ncbi:YbaB/EbfC family nucleoid-associated protein [Nonomuraea sediminis]|uniref:YbaB/EbfC family nucleoid-associated protein n=1 Tax=Nonomuraea sediminis TaxID=2835864 RepID=UPI001BDCE4C8|nr:YbaB/EbfC family nucleoid-associated protein [Nonomuraea sediminis]